VSLGGWKPLSRSELVTTVTELVAIAKAASIGFQLPDKVSDLSRSGKLGLAGIRERVRLLGGNLEIKSEPDKSTTVIVEAPI